MENQGVQIGDVLLKELTLLNEPSFQNKEELFLYISDKFEESGVVSDKEAFRKSLEDREELGPTYMGDFIAIPHGKCKEVIKAGVSFIRCKEFTYRSGDEEGPVKYVFVLAVEDDQEDNSHLRILATIASYLMKDEFKELIAGVQSYDELISGINKIGSL